VVIHQQDIVLSHTSKHTFAFLQTNVRDFIEPPNWPSDHMIWTLTWISQFGALFCSWYIRRRYRYRYRPPETGSEQLLGHD